MPKWLSPPLVFFLVISAIGSGVVGFYTVVDNYSWTLDKAIGSAFFETTIRKPVKEFFDTHFFITILTLLCVPVFCVCLTIVALQCVYWSGESHPNRLRIVRRVAYLVCMVPLAVVGWFIGGFSANFVIWSAPLTLTGAALLSELVFPPQHRSWLRPLFWGAALGAIAELAK